MEGNIVPTDNVVVVVVVGGLIKEEYKHNFVHYHLSEHKRLQLG